MWNAAAGTPVFALAARWDWAGLHPGESLHINRRVADGLLQGLFGCSTGCAQRLDIDAADRIRFSHSSQGKYIYHMLAGRAYREVDVRWDAVLQLNQCNAQRQRRRRSSSRKRPLARGQRAKCSLVSGRDRFDEVTHRLPEGRIERRTVQSALRLSDIPLPKEFILDMIEIVKCFFAGCLRVH
jgi:hypothetical protein